MYFSLYAYSVQYKVSCGIQVSPCLKTPVLLNLDLVSFEDIASLCEHLPQSKILVPLVQPQGLLHIIVIMSGEAFGPTHANSICSSISVM